ncbi:C2H2 type zinc-finger-domain-containing protein [Lasiosphaeria hispida]|uniref:C2H2 type zinc-finger-domain-containing protein n=1 Tax=Lasiosphaeria hispida TaxID=260671 RepID=A0AAJ0HKR2_9PEZI|nr:C2H2 type zinc-finger-domain-containing protein [Lasiosphaeria hispida]
MDYLSAFKLSSKQCGACNVALESDGARRAHSKTEWHVENLRRRVAGFPPLDASAFSASATLGLETRSIDLDQDSSSSSDESGDTPDSEDAPEFIAEQCLFCNHVSDSFDDNVLHMQKFHGLFINNLDRLVVDLETLARYLHLIIFGYHECLYCHSRRRTVEAAQQHMLGKGHCSIDIQNPDSEYRDFFDFTTENTGDEGSGSRAGNAAPSASEGSSRPPGPSRGSVASATAGQAIQGDQPHCTRNPVSVSSKNRHAPPSENQSDNKEPAPTLTSSLQALTRSERRGISPTDQLANSSVNDQISLAHILPSQQRAVLTVQKKQLDKAQRAELRNSIRVEMMGNKTLMKHFISDIPARRLKYSWC